LPVFYSESGPAFKEKKVFPPRRLYGAAIDTAEIVDI
jgi:hypothetical protein